MRSRPFKRSTRELIASIALAALVFRALVPAGFMPASDQPFSIEICRGGFLAQLPSHDAPGSLSHFEYCLFCCGSAAGSAPQIAVAFSVFHVNSGPVFTFEPSPINVQFIHVPQPRGPPPIA
jgi:hypothetical protein